MGNEFEIILIFLYFLIQKKYMCRMLNRRNYIVETSFNRLENSYTKQKCQPKLKTILYVEQLLGSYTFMYNILGIPL